VIASHYAAPARRTIAAATSLRKEPSDDSPSLAELESGDPFDLLDDSRGWAWGYAGTNRLVGYIRSEALSA